MSDKLVATEQQIDAKTQDSNAKRRGRKPKYNSEEERKKAKNEYNRAYRQKIRQELAAARRTESKNKAV